MEEILNEPSEIRRKRLKNFLLVHSHYEKNRLIRKAKDENLYPNSEGDEDVYQSLKRFADHHGIKIEQTELIEKFTSTNYVEEIDDDGNTKLKLINNKKENEENKGLKTLLLKRRDELSEEILSINKLLKFYEQ